MRGVLDSSEAESDVEAVPGLFDDVPEEAPIEHLKEVDGRNDLERNRRSWLLMRC
jgi:hypothetical protein